MVQYVERGDEAEMKGEHIAEWMQKKRNVNVFNEASELYTFSGPNGESDMDATFGNEAALEWVCEWQVMDVPMSNHNLIMMEWHHERTGSVDESSLNWNVKGANWSMYGDIGH